MLNKKAFTLVEVMVSFMIFMLITSVVTIGFISSQRSFTTGVALMDVSNDARMGADSIENDLTWAVLVEPSHTVGTDTYVTGDTELVLSIPSIDGVGDIVDGYFDYVIYHLNTTDPTLLERIVDPSSSSSRTLNTHIVARNVSTLNFSCNGTGLSSIAVLSDVSNVTASITTSKTVLGGRNLQKTLTITGKLRNY